MGEPHEKIQGKRKPLFQAFRGIWGGGGKGSDKHTRYSNSPSCLLPTLSFLIEGRYSSVKGIATEGGRGGGVVFLSGDVVVQERPL